MSEEWSIGKRRPSTVSDWKKLIQDFRDQFPYDPLTALIVETFANAIDAKATKVEIQIDGDIYRIIDNGQGMTSYQLKEYHNIASMTKHRGEGIGFAGVGAKVFLDRAECIVTETRSVNFNHATLWAFRGESLEWEPIPLPNKLKYPTGTCVEVKLGNSEDKSKLTCEFIETVLHQNYNAVLSGYYHLKSVTINGNKVKPWQVPENKTEKRKDFDFRYGSHRIKGFFIKSTEAIPEEFQGPFIVVYGKTVMQWWFRQYPIKSETFYGMILADHLIDILRTSKSDFERTSMLWKKFHGKMGRVLSDWLDEIGAKPKLPTSTDLDDMTRELERSVNSMLKMPELVDLANIIFQNIIQRTTAIQNEQGKLSGIEIQGAQTTTGTLGGPSEGEGVSTIGEDEGSGMIENENGITPIERVRRRIRGGIKIGYDEKLDNSLEGWIDPGVPAIIINRGHPAWKVADGLTLETGDERVRGYHVLRTVFTILAEEGGGSPKETFAKLFSCWHDSYVRR
ncbi:MAG TPA: ATP-binding protein [Acidobacteriota bacterium]|nr:ATP-binding protein [Acidobacteriota bacterium]